MDAINEMHKEKKKNQHILTSQSLPDSNNPCKEVTKHDTYQRRYRLFVAPRPVAVAPGPAVLVLFLGLPLFFGEFKFTESIITLSGTLKSAWGEVNLDDLLTGLPDF